MYQVQQLFIYYQTQQMYIFKFMHVTVFGKCAYPATVRTADLWLTMQTLYQLSQRDLQIAAAKYLVYSKTSTIRLPLGLRKIDLNSGVASLLSLYRSVNLCFNNGVDSISRWLLSEVLLYLRSAMNGNVVKMTFDSIIQTDVFYLTQYFIKLA